jgi:rod shape determining protein RodA
MFAASMVDIKLFLRYAYPFYFATLALLIVVEVAGYTGMGATRWIDLKFIKLQPSELMKIALVMALAKYFHTSTLQSIETVRGIVPPLMMALVPAALIMAQPDLGNDAVVYHRRHPVCGRRAGVEVCRAGRNGGGSDADRLAFSA